MLYEKSWHKSQLEKISMKKTIIFGLLSALLLTACSSYPKFDITVTPSQELVKKYGTYPSVEVDIAGLSESDAVKFSSYPVDRYFENDSSLRGYLEPYTMHFSAQDLKAKTLRGDSEVFERIMEKEPSHLVLIANLPFADKDSKTLDPRKYIMKIDTGMLATMSDLYLKIGATGLIKSTRLDSIKDSPEALESDKQPIKLSLSCTTVKGSKNMDCKETPKDSDKKK